ncbi:hypothetical protein AAOE16_04325 [Ekhidna sp. MALMAid0563]|uniref:hypothetical protein n=1 Tax=Ekhidna sp. MALMAid0563 TaxID=3143937 RepID=UPI0032DFB3EB
MKRTIMNIKMKMINKVMMYSCFIAVTFLSSAQEIDVERMARDLKIAEDILGTLSEQDSRLFYQDNIESNYVPDYGVVFTIPMKPFVFKSTGSGRVAYSTSGSGVTIIDSRVRRDDRERRDREDGASVTVDVVPDDEEEVKVDESKIMEEMEAQTREQIETFLADYADLIGQLKPSDRIVVQTKNRNEVYIFNSRGSNKSSAGMSAQVLKSDISSFKQGKLSRDEFMGKIEFSEGGEEVAKDVELFATIFSRLYEPDLSSTYYLSSRRIAYNRLKNMGVTFSLKFYSSTSDGGRHTIRTTGENGLTQEQRNEKVNAMYPEFERSFKENLLDYGRTIKSLDPNEMLIFKVRLTECRGCEMPDEIKVSVKMKTLQDYDKGALSKNKALEQITITRS